MSKPPTIASESVELTSATTMPILGLGTWQLQGSSAVSAVLRALEVGYRHIDTATAYGNEEQVGQAVAQSGVRREDIFVTTKLPPSRAGRERETLEASLDALEFGYVDLWLIHWPPSGGARPDVWERLLELQAEGLTREVGVSNYSVSQIDELQRATDQLPAVNQIEWSPPLFDVGVLEAHRRRGVQVEGYSPLQDHQPARPAARTNRRSPQRDLGPGGPPLAHRASNRGHPEIGECGPDCRERRDLRVRADVGRSRDPRQLQPADIAREVVVELRHGLNRAGHRSASWDPQSRRVQDHYDRVMAEDKRAGFVAGGPRRARNEGESFWAFLRHWIASLFRVDRRM